MKRTLFTTTLICAALLGGAVIKGQAGTSNDSTAKEIMAAFDTYVVGWHDGNLKQLTGSYLNDGRVSAYWPDPSRGGLLEGWTRISTDLDDIFTHSGGMDLDFHDRKIEVYGNTAVLTSLWTWAAPPSPSFTHGRVTFVFVKQGKQWRVVHEHSSVMPFIPGDPATEKQ